ncbi:sulfotransferase domain-containing protein [Parvibaculum sp.]|uniref:sulfotransferase domain-containing protein n=1 Tax=Parvibaculum sp. TaxID=2024848 RepID=UPI002CB9A5C1|nr:sulfotransferase domain-containing protein [Parvibaculum sp.]HUD53379.1 sulfotransferase domain-containing protein [Parvibaculum sp.]
MGGIVWLASFPKSGNTWVRHFLHSILRGGREPHDINKMDTLTVGDASANWYLPLLGKPLEQCTDAEVARVRPQVARSIAARAEGLVFVKTHNALVTHLGVPMIEGAVTAGIVYIVRNPLDVVISLANFQSASVDTAIDQIIRRGSIGPTNERFAYQYFGSWAEHVESWTRRPMRQLHVMRYEDMLEKPAETFGTLAQFLLLKPSASELKRAIDASSFERLQKEEDERGFIERPQTAERFFREGRSGQWKELLTSVQIRRVIDALRPQMERFGYLP